MPKQTAITIALPKLVSQPAFERAQAKAREAAVISLQQEGELTIREAAAQINLSYEAYLDLLAQYGLPATQEEEDEPEVLEELLHAARQRKR